ncbi:MAG: AsmA family protein [Comamonadaceae bacterium]|nr:MAG: AsmA family protein [Comamonadaceae bacterium]
MTTVTTASKPGRLKKILAVVIAVLVLLVLLVVFFPWDWLRGPINRYVSDKTGRHFAITRHLDVKLGRTITVIADGVEFANPDWAKEPYLLKAEGAEFDIRFWPLLSRKIELPRISLKQPEVGLQIEPDGRRTWVLSRDTKDTGSAPVIGSLTVDKGKLHYFASAQGADVTANVALAAENSSEMPLTYDAKGKWRNAPFTAKGRTGGVLQLSEDMAGAFPMEVDAAAGRTTLKANGSVTNLSEFAGIDATFDLRGRNLDELYNLLGVVLPSTPPYKLQGKLTKDGAVWSASQIQGVLGSSDLNGTLNFDPSGKTALLTGKVQSKVLDFEDLAPIIGLPATAVSGTKTIGSKQDAPVVATSAANKKSARAASQAKPQPKQPGGKILPTATLDLARLNAMNADVTYSAASIRHLQQLPLDSGSVHVKLTDGVMNLEPLALGVAGGSLAGRIYIDSTAKPASVEAKLNVRGMELNRLFPTVETTKSSFGKVSGQIDLKSRGNSAAQMLGAANGNVAVLMGRGELSNILLEFVGLDGGEVIKFLARGDRNVQLRCAAAAFDVKQGLMDSRTIVLDTVDTVVTGDGNISLRDETLDIVLRAAPKDKSILSFRSPLKISGTFASPSAFPDKVALAGRVGLAVALGTINPLLALAATIETGPGTDMNCRDVLATADPKNQVPASAKPPPVPAAAASAVSR